MENKKIHGKTHFFIASFLSLIILISVFTPLVYAEIDTKDYDNEVILGIAENIIHWKKSDISIDAEEYLLNNSFLENAGDTSGDWYPIGMGRLGYSDDYVAYLAIISDEVSQRYLEDTKLSSNKATEWHRISLAILSMGGDPTNIGKDADGNPINLIGDGTYNRGKASSLGAQGINGWIWGLITLDSMRYEIPQNSFYTRDDIIIEIIKRQVDDGGFSLDGVESDPDITGMTIQALAPYYNSEQEYTYVQYSLDRDVSKKVRDVIEEALDYLSKAQLSNGGFLSWGMENSESAAQALVALTSLGIDPLKDERFIKEGNTILDFIMSFQMEDGGFLHSRVYDSDNPSANPDESNSMASEQALYSLVSLLRLRGGHRSLYDFRPEMNEEIKSLVEEVEESIDKTSEPFNAVEIEDIFNQYMKIPIAERSYVYNYQKLSEAMEYLEIENTSEFISANIGTNTQGRGAITSISDRQQISVDEFLLKEEDIKKYKDLPEDLTTEHYIEIIKLIYKIEESENREEYIDLLNELYLKKDRIDGIQKEIDSLNEDILDKLYPFQDISIKDRDDVENIIQRYKSLSDYDKKKILHYEDVIKSEIQIDNLIRGRIIAIVIFVIVIILVFITRHRIKKRKLKKMKDKMLFFEDEED